MHRHVLIEASRILAMSGIQFTCNSATAMFYMQCCNCDDNFYSDVIFVMSILRLMTKLVGKLKEDQLSSMLKSLLQVIASISNIVS